MSKYTTQLRWIAEQMGQGLPIPEGQHFADAVYKYIGLSEYPIFDETYRSGLNDKIIEHFYFREIGFETAAQFSFYMRRTMNEIMPKYNALYKAQLTMDDVHPLSDYVNHREENWTSHVDDDSQRGISTSETENATRNDGAQSVTSIEELAHDNTTTTENLDTARTLETTENETTTVQFNEHMTDEVDETTSSTDSRHDVTETTTDNHNRNVFEDTPMSLLSNSGSPSVENLDYATNVTYDDGTTETNSETTVSGTAQSTVGKDGVSTKTGTDTTTRALTSGDDEQIETDKTGTEQTTSDKTVSNEQETTREIRDAKTASSNVSDIVERDKDDTGRRLLDEYGNRHSWAYLMEEFAEKWQNIDMMVIGELETLFMGVW